GCNLQVERMSDLLSMWVGESEKNMANAFRKAASQGSILLLDEFDSLAYDRNKAQRSWEVSQTNELLQQIENYPGVLIASTNLVDSLDQAISRRFSHKVGFAGLRKAARVQAVTDYFRDWLGIAELDGRKQARLEMIPNLYPGDLRAVRQRFAADVLLGETPAPEALVAALEHEASFRKSESKPIGFKD
ncbi:MAG: ATP-binding protein, partial [Deltaproteobacteria bacterium]|nr:ATP-binding protein [Deltaproteobacteria bacterium]